jgi:hypothetical protein
MRRNPPAASSRRSLPTDDEDNPTGPPPPYPPGPGQDVSSNVQIPDSGGRGSKSGGGGRDSLGTVIHPIYNI